MKYSVEYSNQAFKDLKKLDKYTRLMIRAWIDKNLEECENPTQHGRALVGNLGGYWRYRVGDYRIICKIQEDRIIILVLSIGHRKEIYK